VITDVVRELLEQGTTNAYTKKIELARLTDKDLLLEQEDVESFYENKDLSLADKYEQEKYHYAMLLNACMHKVRANKYFHDEGIESRKNIVFSDDCISMIQFFCRNKRLTYITHLRSSNTIELLPSDLFALLGICKTIQDEYCPDTKKIKWLLTIGHAHTDKNAP